MIFMEKNVGKVVAAFRLWNIRDEKSVETGEKNPLEEDCLVDTGAVMAVIPERVARDLDLPRETTGTRVRFADGRTGVREVAFGLRLEIMGRRTECQAIIEPGRDTVLIGQIVLEALDLLVDCKEQKLFPRDPLTPIHEVLAFLR
jgi:predicted aspartyl protease